MARALLILSLILIPYLWGGRHPLAFGLLGCVLAVSAIAYGLSIASAYHFRYSSVWGLLLFIPVIGFTSFQLHPISFPFISDAMRTLWSQAVSTGLFDQVQGQIAVDQVIQIEMLSCIVLVGIFYLLISQLFSRLQWVLVLALAVVFAAGLNSLIGLVVQFGQYNWFYFVTQNDTKVVQAGFMNHNHFAQFSAMGLLLTIGILTAIRHAHHGSRLAELISRRWRRILFYVLLLISFADALAIVYSYSRGGFLSAGLGVISFALWLLFTRKDRSFSTPVMIFTFVALALSIYGIDALIQRFEIALADVDSSTLIRYELWKVAQQIIVMNPWTGSGFGAFNILCPLFDTSFMPGYISPDAHNDYLDLLAIYGVPFGGYVICSLLVLIGYPAIQLLNCKNKHSTLYPIAVAAMFALLVALLHEVVDYGLKRPANLMEFTAIAVVLFNLTKILVCEDGYAAERSMKINRSVLVFIGCLIIAACFPLAIKSYQSYELGRQEVIVSNFVNSKEIDLALSPLNKAKEIIHHSDLLLEQTPNHRYGLAEGINARRRFITEVESDYLAKGISRILDRDISVEQVRRAMYHTYYEQAFSEMSAANKETLAAGYDEIAQLCLRLSQSTPLSARYISAYAVSLDRAMIMRGQKPDSTIDYHRYALSMNPWQMEVIENALRNYIANSLYKRDDKLIKEILHASERLVYLKPNALSWLLPQLWDLVDDKTRLGTLKTQSIVGLEIWTRFLLRNDQFDEAIATLETMQSINNARFDEETTETLGNIGFMRRERRSKEIIDLMAETLKLSIYKKQRNQEAIEHTLISIRNKKKRINGDKLTRIDHLIEEGQWLLAETTIHQIKDDERAQLRLAELLLRQARYIRLKHVLAHLNEHREMLDEVEIEKLNDIDERYKNILKSDKTTKQAPQS